MCEKQNDRQRKEIHRLEKANLFALKGIMLSIKSEQKPPILPGLTYLTPLHVNQELHNDLSLKNERGQLNTSFFFPVDIVR